MMEFIQAGGSVAIIIIAVVLILQAIVPLLKGKGQSDNINNLFTQHDHTRLLNDLTSMVKVQNHELNRMADALEKMAVDTTHIKDSMDRLPKSIASELRRGNGHA